MGTGFEEERIASVVGGGFVGAVADVFLVGEAAEDDAV